MSNDELACVYASLILADDKVAITADKLQKLTSAAGLTVESYWFDLFANALGSKDINDLLLSASSAPAAAAPAAAAPAAGGAAPAKEAAAPAKEEPAEEEAAMAFDLFD